MMYVTRQFDEMLRYQQLQQQAMAEAFRRTVESQASMVQLQLSLIGSFQRNMQKAMTQFSDAALSYGRSNGEAAIEAIAVNASTAGTDSPNGEDQSDQQGQPEHQNG